MKPNRSLCGEQLAPHVLAAGYIGQALEDQIDAATSGNILPPTPSIPDLVQLETNDAVTLLHLTMQLSEPFVCVPLPRRELA